MMSLSVTHFEDHNWQEVLDQAEKPICRQYARLFGERMEEAREGGDPEAEELYQTLHSISALHLRLEGDGIPLPGVDELDAERLHVLAEVFASIVDSELRARVGDILWLREVGNSPYQFALEAIDSYVESANRLEGVLNNHPTLRRYARALSLAKRLNDTEKQNVVATALERRIRERAATESSWWLRRYSELLYESDLGDPAEQAQLMGQAAQSIENPEDEDDGVDYGTSRKYWELSARWHFRAGNDKAAHEARRRKAEAYVQNAESFPVELKAVDFYEQALKVYQQIPGTEERRKEIRQKMVETRENAANSTSGQFGRISTPIGNDEIQEHASNQLSGRSLMDGIIELACITEPLHPEAIREQTIELNREIPLQAMIAASKHGSGLRKVTKKPGAFDDPEGALAYQMHENALFNWTWEVANRIEPARRTLVEDHSIEIEDLFPLLEDNPLVPPGRLGSFALGLLAGLKGDFITSTHILTVQLEESIRNLLRERGRITTYLKQEGFEEEYNLNTFLKDEVYRDDMVDLFGEDWVFHLRSLLVDQRGANLRNKTAHALANDSELQEAPSRYYWWLVLHMIVQGSPHIDQLLDETNGSE